MNNALGRLGQVNRRTRTPVYATLLVGAVVLALALSFEVEALATFTSIVTLAIFFMVNSSLILVSTPRLQLESIVAGLGAILCVLLSGAAFLGS
jgi:amino acid transporter